MTTLGKYTAATLATLRQARRTLGAKSPMAFARAYLPAHFNLPLAPMHEEVFDTLDGITARRGSRVAIAAPRGHAKSTVATLAYALWCMLHDKEKLLVIASNTAEQAAKHLGHIKREIEVNQTLLGDFPELAKATQVSPWRKDSILLPNGTMALSYGAGQNLRGARHKQHRPTLIIADDLEDKESVVHEEQRIKTADWFHSTLLKAGTTETNVVAVGTVLHHDSLLAQLIDPSKTPGWKQLRYQAVAQFSNRPDLWERWSALYRGTLTSGGQTGPEAAANMFRVLAPTMLDGTSVLWPQAYSYRDLMETRLREGESSFQAEMQNQPLDPDACIFARARLQYWDDRHVDADRLIAALGERGEFFGGCDPGLGGDPGRGDYSAIVILYQPRQTRVKYVILADLARRTPDQTIDRILQYARMYRISNFGVEANQFQQLMVDDLRRRAREQGISVPVMAIKNRSAKRERITALEAEVSQGMLRFSRQHQLLMEQLRAFPVAKHDDGPDALEMAVQAATSGGNHWQWCCMSTGRVIHDSRWPKGVGFGKEDTMPDRL